MSSDYYLDPAFTLDRNISISADEIDPAHTLTFLNITIKSKPSKLIRHVQRINILKQIKKATQLYDAFIQLHLVLGSSGLPLQNRLLSQCKRELGGKYSQLCQQNVINPDYTIETTTGLNNEKYACTNSINYCI